MPAHIQKVAQHTRVAKLLLDAGARVDACDIAGYSVLHHCTTSMASPESLAIGALVVAAAASPEQAAALANAKNRAGSPPLFEAVMSRRLDCVNFLLHAGADPSLKGPAGVTAFSLSMLMPEIQLAFSAAAARSAKLRGINSSTSFVGVRVRLRDLKSRADLNGRIGMPKSYDPVADRYLVSLEPAEPTEAAADAPLDDARKNETEDVNVRTANLEPAASTKSATRDCCSHCGNANAKSRCLACLATFYCDRTCQAAHWKSAHKKECKSIAETALFTISAAQAAQCERDSGPALHQFARGTAAKKLYNGTDAAARKVTTDGGKFVCKIQVPQSFGVSNDGKLELLMYNEDKTFCFALTPSVVDTAEGRAHFDRLVADIRTNGMFGAKGYYTVRLNEDHGFSISTFKMRPHEGW